MGTAPLHITAFEWGAVGLRSTLQAYVAGLGDSNVLFYDQGNSFDWAVCANYVSADGAEGTRIQPADQGLTQSWNAGYCRTTRLTGH